MNASLERLADRPAEPDAPQGPRHSRDGFGPPLSALDELLTAQVEAARRLRASLAAERFALERRDSAALAVAAADKAQAVAALEAVERRRRVLCMRIGAGPGQPELAAWLDAFSTGDAASNRLRARAQELAEMLRDCRAVHEATSIVVSLLHRQVQHGLAMLGETGPPVGRPALGATAWE